jgi:trimeric autotransporter adhesin
MKKSSFFVLTFTIALIAVGLVASIPSATGSTSHSFLAAVPQNGQSPSGGCYSPNGQTSCTATTVCGSTQWSPLGGVSTKTVTITATTTSIVNCEPTATVHSVVTLTSILTSATRVATSTTATIHTTKYQTTTITTTGKVQTVSGACSSGTTTKWSPEVLGPDHTTSGQTTTTTQTKTVTSTDSSPVTVTAVTTVTTKKTSTTTVITATVTKSTTNTAISCVIVPTKILPTPEIPGGLLAPLVVTIAAFGIFGLYQVRKKPEQKTTQDAVAI